MTFEAIVYDSKEASYTVQDVKTGSMYYNCRLCTMGIADWCISKGDWVLCQSSDAGYTYILGEIKNNKVSSEGFRIGGDSEKFVITESATLIHKKETSETLIDEDGLTSFYKKAVIKGFGWSITCEDNIVTISVGGEMSTGSGIVITPTDIKLFGDDQGGILKGNDGQKQIDDIVTKLKTLTEHYLAHGHEYINSGGTPTASSLPAGAGIALTLLASKADTSLNVPSPSSVGLQSTKVKSS